jgi:pimeloyl-ACP methyl ester carboxylesterase
MEQAFILGQRLAYMRRGDGVPFVFLHGLGADRRQSLSALSGVTGADLICPDLPGHGGSDPSTYDFATFVSILEEFLDHLGVERAVFGGISMGAALSMRMALVAPHRVAGLALVRPAWINSAALPHLSIVARVGRWLSECSPTTAAARLELDRDFAEIGRTNQPAADSIRGLLTRPQASDAADVLHDMVHDRPFTHMSDLDTIQCPALVIANPDDPLHPVAIAQHIYGRLPNAEYQLLPSRYLAPAEHFRALARAINTFLRSEEITLCSQSAPRLKRSLQS